jgi:hypothetical protein
MHTSHKHTHLLLLVLTFLATLVPALGQTSFPSPGVSDQQAGWMLVYPYYTSRSSNQREDTFITITNASSNTTVAVHLFFLEGRNCAQADMFLCLTPNASQAFKASEMDPDNTGYIIAYVVAETGPLAGCPATTSTVLIGNAFVSLPNDGIQGNYGAEAFSSAGASCTLVDANTAQLTFNAPNRFAVEVQSPLTIPNQRVVMAGLAGNLNSTLSGTGQVGAGQIINGNEAPSGSFTGWIPEGCLTQAVLTNGSPRVPNGMGRLLPAGEVGTIKFNARAAVGLLMVPTNTAGRSGIRSLHKLGTASTTLTVGIFSVGC